MKLDLRYLIAAAVVAGAGLAVLMSVAAAVRKVTVRWRLDRWPYRRLR